MAPETVPVKRRDRAVEDEAWIRAFLRQGAHCTIAAAPGGRPLLLPDLYVWRDDPASFFFHTGGAGTAASLLRDGLEATACVSEMGRLLPGPRVTDFSVEYCSVIVSGPLVRVDDPAAAREYMEHQLDKYFPHLLRGRDYATFTDLELSRAQVYRIDVARWSAKRHAADPGHEGAFTWTPPGAGR